MVFGRLQEWLQLNLYMYLNTENYSHIAKKITEIL